ncbi:type II toxin-antitoxin system PemK/MazF family toxin [Candidatus Micrarchaeota archaeon]|nr:type II toxin-antitoxin system PemK/MazF family toxin [Candidatus Micrarchaeota archaeon]
MLSGRGHEQAGTRPGMVVASANGLTTAIPLTTNANRLSFPHTFLLEPTKENGLSEPSVALVFQITACDDSRFKKMIGFIPAEKRSAIDGMLKSYFKLS